MHVFVANAYGGAETLNVVRKEQTNAAKPLLQRQGLALELHPMVAENPRPNIGLRGNLHVRVPEFEDEFGLADRESVLVRNPAAQDESVVVKAEVLGIDEQHFADLDWLRDEVIGRELCPVLFGRLAHDLSKVKEALARIELVGPQNQFAAEVLDMMERHPVGIPARLELRNAPHPTGCLSLPVL